MGSQCRGVKGGQGEGGVITCLVEGGLGGVEVDDGPDRVVAVLVLLVAGVLGVPMEEVVVYIGVTRVLQVYW